MTGSRGKIAGSKASSSGCEIRGVDIRPLFTDTGPDEMAKNLFRLLYCLGVKSADICQITVSKYEGAASVYVRTTECENYLMTIFQDPASIMNQYDLRRITKDPRKLYVSRIATQRRSNQENLLPISVNMKAPALDSEVETDEIPSNSAAMQQVEVQDGLQDQKKAPSAPSKYENGIVQASESSSTSLTYSQCDFEQLESEENRPKKINYFTNSATSTTDIPMFSRKKKIRQNGNKETVGIMPNDNLEGMEQNASSQIFDSSEHANDENCFSNKCAEVILNQGKICQVEAVFFNPPNLEPENIGTDKSKTETVINPLNLGLEKIGPNMSKTETVINSHKPDISSSLFSSQDAPKSLKTSPNDNSNQEVIKLHAKTSTPAVPPCGCPETIFYHLQQHIGTETRHAEFKRGGIVREQGLFRSMVGKYVCGFLNSEGGTLYFGVSDDGKVLGIKVDSALEETLREDVDFAVRSLIEPDVDPSEYSVNFARIMKPDGELSEDLRVMEVCVKPRTPPKRDRFSCDNVVYIRRDGSLQATARTGRTLRDGVHGQRRAC